MIEPIEKNHRNLAAYNRHRVSAGTPDNNWKESILEEAQMRLLEGEVLHWEIQQIRDKAAQAPTNPQAFMNWYEDLKQEGPGQNDPLFDWLEKEADQEQMRWFICQEVAGEAGFDDLTALTQLKLPTRAKLEVARNFWDEMGRGRSRAMHGPMLNQLAVELDVDQKARDQNQIVTEALALGNILLGFAVNRRYAYHSLGALGAVELTAPGRAEKVFKGLSRLDISPEGQKYYRLHATIDVKHSQDWNREVIHPLIEENPSLIPFIAEGALVRLNAGARCFQRYKEHFEQ